MRKNNKTRRKKRSRGFEYTEGPNIAVCAPLNRQEELAAAENITRLEQTLWETIFDNPAKARFTICRIRDSESLPELLDDSPELKALLNRALKLGSKAISGKRKNAYGASASKLASKLREIDTDRKLVAEAAEKAILRSRKKSSNGRDSLSSYGKSVEKALAKVDVAKHDFIRANQGLVTLIAKRYRQRWIPLNDLIQEGNLGLIKAVNRFDYTKGFQFCTYASWWIRASISRAIDDKESMIRIPGSQLRTRSKLKKAVKSFRQRSGRNPTDGEIAVETGLGSLLLERAQRHLITRVYSLDQMISDSNSLRYIDVLTDDTALNPIERISTATLAQEVSVLLEELTPLERNIIHQRFGFEDFEAATLREIGEQYGLSRERIRQIQNRALNKIRSRISLDAA
jgi:RNA polymerase primary sigma factor